MERLFFARDFISELDSDMRQQAQVAKIPQHLSLESNRHRRHSDTRGRALLGLVVAGLRGRVFLRKVRWNPVQSGKAAVAAGTTDAELETPVSDGNPDGGKYEFAVVVVVAVVVVGLVPTEVPEVPEREVSLETRGLLRGRHGYRRRGGMCPDASPNRIACAVLHRWLRQQRALTRYKGKTTQSRLSTVLLLFLS